MMMEDDIEINTEEVDLNESLEIKTEKEEIQAIHIQPAPSSTLKIASVKSIALPSSAVILKRANISFRCMICNLPFQNADHFQAHNITVHKSKSKFNNRHRTDIRRMVPVFETKPLPMSNDLDLAIKSTKVVKVINKKTLPIKPAVYKTPTKIKKPPTVDERFKCGHCNLNLLSKLELQEHMKIHKKLSFKCQVVVCNYITTDYEELKRHFQLHTQALSYKRRQKYFSALFEDEPMTEDVHVENNEGGKSKQNEEHHLKDIQEGQAIDEVEQLESAEEQSNQSEEQVITIESEKRNMSWKHGNFAVVENSELLTVCNLCNKTVLFAKLDDHLANHWVQNCEICGIRLLSSSQFEKHMKTHNNKIFKCLACEFRTIDHVKFKQHLQQHERAKQLKQRMAIIIKNSKLRRQNMKKAHAEGGVEDLNEADEESMDL